MSHLFKYWNTVESRLRGKNVFVFLDYDGTLTPIVDNPEDAILSSMAKDLLWRLSIKRSCKVGIISGRSLEDLVRKVGLDGIIYAGNHGLEIKGVGSGVNTFLTDDMRRAIRQIKEELCSAFSGIDGVFLEDKGLSLSLHYRLVKDDDVPKVKKILRNIVKSSNFLSKTKVVAGKKVFEIRPAVEWDKGKALTWLWDHEGFRDHGRQTVSIYIGDDITDVDAFKVLGEDDFAIWVGENKRLYTRYTLNDCQEVLEFLSRLYSLLS